LRTALAIVDGDGLGGLTIRKLATRLGVTPMAIYRHYKNKAAIEHELVDLVVGDYDVTKHSEKNWQEWICRTYLLMRHALCAHPGIIPLLDGATYSGSNAMRVMEKVLDVLLESGLSAQQAVALFHTAMAYTVGAVVLMDEDSRLAVAGVISAEDAGEQSRQRGLTFELVPRGEYPRIVELAKHLAASPEDARFRHNLLQILLPYGA
jgi:AcrR family transcriptional regulator